MRHLLGCILLALGAGVACAQGALSASAINPDLDPDLLQAWPAWFVGDHVKARRHFQIAATRGIAMAQYNLAMMMLYREGGPCRTKQAEALLRKASDHGVGLALEALGQLRAGKATHSGFNAPFPCLAPGEAQQSPGKPRTSHIRAAH